MRPLGLAAARKPSLLSRLAYGRIAACCLAVLCLGAAGYAALFGDRWGGQPRVVVPVRIAEAPPPAPVPPSPPVPSRQQNAARDVDVEVTSGVSVVTPHRAGSASGSVIRMSDAEPIRLAAAPDSRLVEASRLGALPRIGADGARPSEIYARQPGTLADGTKPVARIAVLVGGLGLSAALTREAIARLPDAVTLGFAPYGEDLPAAVARAREAGHEVMLQMPMEPLDYPKTDPGPQTLTVAARPAENLERLRWGMSRFSGFVGVSNFLGGRLTADTDALTPILREIGSRGLIFVDDGSSSRSSAAAVSEQLQVSNARADIVIDSIGRPELIDRALERLEVRAREKGFAIGSASALPLSVERIARWAGSLEAKGILIVPVSALAGQGRAP